LALLLDTKQSINDKAERKMKKAPATFPALLFSILDFSTLISEETAKTAAPA
jgi:hypothetical protein